jgi:hypothetical protein
MSKKRTRKAARSRNNGEQQAATAETPAAPRVRKSGRKMPCAKCGADGFVYKTAELPDSRYPSFLRRKCRRRYYRCGGCKHTWSDSERLGTGN